jgi:uncharacterized oxidoreductase
MNLSNNKILITGGATGIGFGLAERFLREKNEVIICGRRMDALENAKRKHPSLIIKQVDLTDEKGRIGLYDWINTNHADTNILVNNAGVQQWMSINDADFYQRAKEEININIIAPVHLTSLFLKSKSIRTIMNVTSGLSFVPLLKTPVYSATKAFFHSFTMSMEALLKKNDIEVIEVIPPALNTDLGGKGIHDFAPPVTDFIDAIFKQLSENKNQLTFGFSQIMLDAEPTARKEAFTRMNQLEKK